MANRIEELNYVPEMPEKARNIVIVGAGGIVSGSHLPAYKMAGYPVVGIYDLDHEKAEKAAKEFGIPNAVPELEQLIELGVREDAVFDIAVPASKTASILRLLPDNAAVLMQKPMGESIEQAKEILDICHAKNLTAGVNFQLRQAPYMTGGLWNFIHGTCGVSCLAWSGWKLTITAFTTLTVSAASWEIQKACIAKLCSIPRCRLFHRQGLPLSWITAIRCV